MLSYVLTSQQTLTVLFLTPAILSHAAPLYLKGHQEAACFMHSPSLSRDRRQIFRHVPIAPRLRQAATFIATVQENSWQPSPLYSGPDGDNGAAQNWLQSLKKDADESSSLSKTNGGMSPSVQGQQQTTGEEEPGNVYIPSTGVSVSDTLVDAQRDEFKNSFDPVTDVPGVAMIRTEPSNGGQESARYLVALSPPTKKASKESSPENGDDEMATTSPTAEKYVLVDVPPYSDDLAAKIRSFMGESAKLSAILVTNRDSVHYDESPAVYVTRKSDMVKWQAAFPGVEIVMYRLDIPRDCRDIVTQRLDGYGPWGLDEGKDGSNSTFVETGRPLTVMEWDEDTRGKVMDEGEVPPDDDDEGGMDSTTNDIELYTPQAIREKEEGKRILALYTPGRTFGSISYVFPDVGVCCSGYAIPIEAHKGEFLDMGAGPKLDYRGYVTTNSAGIDRQVESARHLISTYSDRFKVVLSANGEATVLGGDAAYRARMLLEVLSQYEKIGQIYEQLGITSTK